MTEQAAVVTGEALSKAQVFIEEEEGAANRMTGWVGHAITAAAVAMSLFHLYAAYAIVPTQVLRPVHVAMVLTLTFLLFPIAKRFRHRILWWDIVCAAVSVAVVVYMIQGGDDFMDRNTSPARWD